MRADPLLLTVVLECTGELDREGGTYRRLLNARLKHEDQYALRVHDEELDTASIRALCDEIDSTYVVFVRSTHEVSATYLSTLLQHLQNRTVYLAEPTLFTGALPKNIAKNAVSAYARDTDVYGIAYNTSRLRDFLDAEYDLDRSALYIAYRLYWSINRVAPLEVGYSIASDTKAAIGLQLDCGVARLLPLLTNAAPTMRTYILRFLVLYLRGLRESQDSDVPLAHVRELIRMFCLTDILDQSRTLQPFETAWIQWIDDSSHDRHLYKRLSTADNYLVFALGEGRLEADIELYRCRFGEDIVQIGKSYLSTSLRPGLHNPKVVDFYRRPITPRSTILFFDRPMQADDNAEHLYSYFRDHYPEYSDIYFALNPKSPDWPRLEEEGFRLVPMFSAEFRKLFVQSDLVVSSQIYNLKHQGKSLVNSRFVYLQHGIQLNDMSDWVLSKHFDVFVATGKLEADYLGALAPVETLNSGLPRLESLRRTRTEQRRLLFMPTWRFNLHQHSSGTFTKSVYYQAIDAVLTDRSLLCFLEEQDLTLEVKLHPNVEKRAHLFHFSDRVVHSSMSYREAFRSAEFVFTDYSSAVLDAAFINTPIAYYQWDADEFFEDQPYESRLDYTTQGLGPTFFDHSGIIDHIVSGRYLEPDPTSDARREIFFEGVDPTRICETIVERMLSL
ncbi:CDP-glycerol glycerophosphotransferase family protein [Brachybacterium sacelli]|uniref:CDP-glycerol glycerophosphotransferase (TagB/SpsB family) n=1 Tax=Brachybacterium sacelli TaxID=173364 RepID=A0ABS4WVH0_9MICO|nr:CDP-glycerol glycerophosphotransferase family protein [Brachybacterium sacelli]MBP2380200.1 CDP-glycerol glycerophosphotransferase (TagB/SpsB family) [Brachybacterium sacelli]